MSTTTSTHRQRSLASALPGYEIGGELGRGGYGVVRAGRHRQLGRAVAIKELPQVLSQDPQVRERFVAEARTLAALDHPHVVPVYDYVEQDGLCALVMESLPGGTVWDRFTADGMSRHAACAVAMVTCAGLHHAHERGVLHRDVKPENVLFSGDGALKVTDFGIAKVVGGGDALATSAGEILGTPAYMAPEQAEGKDLGPQADVYATGVMLYELLCGQLPFSEAGGGLQIVYRHVYEQPTPLRAVAPEVSPALADVVMRALARSPEERFASAEAFGVAVARAMTAEHGSAWLDRTAVRFLTAGPILSAAQPPTVDVASGTPRGRETVLLPGAPPADPGVTRPRTVVHVSGALPTRAAAGSLVPVRQVLDVPRRPVGLLAAAGLVLAATAAVAALGGAPPPEPPAPGTVAVAGTDVTDEPVPVDLEQPVELRLTDADPAVTGARLLLDVVGVPLVPSSVGELLPGDGARTATVSADADAYLLAGPVDATLVTLDAAGTTLSRTPLRLDPARSGFLTVPGGLAAGLALFALAYTESVLRPLRRRGRHSVLGTAGAAGVGAVLGVALVALAWPLGLSTPSLPQAGAAAALGAASVVLLALAAVRSGRRARLSRVAAARR